jgi:hypothetical protein
MVEQFTEARVQILNTNISFEGARGATHLVLVGSLSLSAGSGSGGGSGRNFRTRLHSRTHREATAEPIRADCYKLLHEDNRLRGVRVILMEHHTDHMPALNYLFPRE